MRNAIRSISAVKHKFIKMAETCNTYTHNTDLILVALPRDIGRHTTGSETLMGLNENRHPKDNAHLLKNETLQNALDKVRLIFASNLGSVTYLTMGLSNI